MIATVTPRLTRKDGTNGRQHHASNCSRRARTRRSAHHPRASDPHASARVGPDPGEGLRAQSLGAPHPPRAGGRGHLPTGARDRGDRRRGRLPWRRILRRSAGRRHDGRHGPHVRRRLRRVYVRPREPGHPVSQRARLGRPRCGSGDAPDLLRFPERRAGRTSRTVDPHPWRHLLHRHVHVHPRQEAKHDRTLDHPQRRQDRGTHGSWGRPCPYRRR